MNPPAGLSERSFQLSGTGATPAKTALRAPGRSGDEASRQAAPTVMASRPPLTFRLLMLKARRRPAQMSCAWRHAVRICSPDSALGLPIDEEIFAKRAN